MRDSRTREAGANGRDQVEQAGGGSYQTKINEALQEHVRRRKEPLEDILRRVVREELQAVSRRA